MDIIKEIGLIVFSYMMGSVPFGLILTKIFISEDIRYKGSGNIGATNVKRVAGPLLGSLTLVLDFAKGYVPVFIAGQMTALTFSPSGDLYMCLVLLAAFLGHLFPVYMKFKSGGKGVATAAGGFCMICAPAFLVAVFVFLMTIYLYNHVSSGSIAGALVLPFALWMVDKSPLIILTAVLTAVCILIRHKDNIKRLKAGTEPVIRIRKT
jgi:glycerol-3-phosphate acyltransferase PlsY